MRKRIWNKCISLLMAAVLAVSILAGTGIKAAAAEVKDVSLTIPAELLLARATYTEAAYRDKVTVDAGASTVKVESVEWKNPNGDSMEDNDQLVGGNEYSVIITLSADSFAGSPTVTVNGENAIFMGWITPPKKLQIEWKFFPSVTTISNFKLTDVPVPGDATKAETYTYEIAEYKVTGEWYQYNAGTQTYDPMDTSAIVAKGGNYRFDLRVDMKAGYSFSTAASVTINDTELGGGIVYEEGEYYENSIYYSTGTAIETVELTIPEPVVGRTLSDAALNKVTVPDGSPYTVTGKWQDEQFSTDGVFTKGQIYYFAYTISAKDGYYLGETVQVFVNGAHEATVEGGGKTESRNYRKSLRNQINEVVLSDVPKAELGKKLQVGKFTIKVPEGANYSAKGEWYYYDWDSEADVLVTSDSNTVVKGQKYTLTINLRADTGYEFAEKYILTIDGASQSEYGGYDTAASEVEYSFLEQISQIEVIGVVEPVVGETPDTSKLQPVAPAKYTITESVWTKGGIWDDEVTQFENGGTYYLHVKVEAMQGYEIAPNASWKMGAGSGSTDSYTSEFAYLSAEYSFATLIPEIRISNIPTVKVGETPTWDITVPADANYNAGVNWFVWNDQSEGYEPMTGVFEEGKTYRLMIGVSAKEGYRFDEDVTKTYLDGVLKPFTLLTLEGYGSVYYAAENAKVIDQVELTIGKPIVGNHYSIAPVITLPDGANYRLRQHPASWIMGNIDEYKDVRGYFAEDGNYGTTFMLTANEGYVFAEDLLVVVNGIALPKEAYSANALKTLHGTYFFNMTCEHVYDNASDTTCNVCGHQRVVSAGSESPETGDQSRISLWMLLAISGLAVVGTNRYLEKERNRRKIRK